MEVPDINPTLVQFGKVFSFSFLFFTDLMDFSQLSLHDTKKLQMQSQVSLIIKFLYWSLCL